MALQGHVRVDAIFLEQIAKLIPRHAPFIRNNLPSLIWNCYGL